MSEKMIWARQLGELSEALSYVSAVVLEELGEDGLQETVRRYKEDPPAPLETFEVTEEQINGEPAPT
ncbi:MAG: hypothetical protein EA351_12290 [Gemmatimonadales bacterium]|nr:MAG: hypothetical protein EA351_12290 [Gemmatimonadales bacterium]